MGAEFTEAAELFIEQFKDRKDPFLSCKVVSSMFEDKYPFLNWHFQWSTWTVFEYTNSTLCPYLSDNPVK